MPACFYNFAGLGNETRASSGTDDSQRDSRKSFAIETPIFTARQADPIRANDATKPAPNPGTHRSPVETHSEKRGPTQCQMALQKIETVSESISHDIIGTFKQAPYINNVQTRYIVKGEAQKSPLFWRFSRGFFDFLRIAFSLGIPQETFKFNI